MAYTSVIPVFRLDNSLDYVRDKEKTAHPVQGPPRKGASAGSLREAIDYALNREKTETVFFEDAIGCTLENAYEDMAATKKQFHKTDKVQVFHLVQSFAEGEVSPELAHLIGVELAERLLKGEFEVVITTHLNTGHYHNHLVWNSVCMTDGHKYRSNSRSYYTEVRKISDDLCRKYGLSIIRPGQGKGKSYAEWMAEKNGKPVWRTAIRSDIREAVNQCFTWNQFLKEMEKRGYHWKLNRKYIALKAPGMERYVRLRSLGDGYSETAIRQRILQPKKTYPSSLSQKNGERRKKLKGLKALYYSYLYQMGVFPEKPKRIPYEVREDIRRLDQRLAQADFLQKHGIITMEDLQNFQNQLGKEMADLITERRRLYRNSPGSERIREITEQLKPVRRKMRMAVKIAEVSKEMAERMKRAEEREKDRRHSREQEHREKREQRGRWEGSMGEQEKLLELLGEKLKAREIRQEKMRSANAYYRKHQTLEGCGALNPEEICSRMKFMEGMLQPKPYPAYSMANNSAQIRRLKKRIEELRKNREAEFCGWEFEGGRAEANKEYNRLQLFFDGKLSLEQRGLLRRAGFHWAASAGAWQRPLNWNAIRAAERLGFVKPLAGGSPSEIQPKAEKKHPEKKGEAR